MAGVCVGAQVFLFGTGIALPIALNSAWIAALFALPCAALVTLLCRRALARRLCSSGEGASARPGAAASLLLCLTLAANAALAAAALVNLAEQTLLAQARVSYSAAVTVLALLLCALSGGTGIARLCFALRWALPAALAVLILLSLPGTRIVGLFPILGAGALPLGVSALCMAGAASPALLLLLPPPELEQAGEAALRCPLPGAGFFVRRVLLGALCGVGLLLCLCACATYESIAAMDTWGERLRLFGAERPGLAQTLLTLGQMIAMLLLGASALCASAQAARAVPALRRYRLDLLLPTALIAAALGAMIVFGFQSALFCAPCLIVPTVLCAIIYGKTGKNAKHEKNGRNGKTQ